MKRMSILAVIAAVILSCTSPVDQGTDQLLENTGSRNLSSAVGLVESNTYGRIINLGGISQFKYDWEGTIAVQNLAYQKNVVVHYSLNGGTWKDLEASYSDSVGGNQEEWTFSVTLGTAPVGQDIDPLDVEFAIKYTVNGQTYWDNNNGQNYVISLGAGSSPHRQYDSKEFGKDFPVVLQGTFRDIPRTWRTVIAANHIGENATVFVRYSLDYWATYQDLPAIKMYDFTFGSGSFWRTELYVEDPAVVSFAVGYTVDGQTYWDNNYGVDHHLLLN